MTHGTRHSLVSGSFPVSCRGQHWSVNGCACVCVCVCVCVHAHSYILSQEKGVISFAETFSSLLFRA